MGVVKALVLCVWSSAGMARHVAASAFGPSQGAGISCRRSPGRLIVSTTQDADVADLLADFRARHPDIDTVHTKINSNDIYNQIVDPSTSTDTRRHHLEFRDGFADQARQRWLCSTLCVEGNRAYSGLGNLEGRSRDITAEPIVIVYNKKLLAEFRYLEPARS